MCTTDNFTSNSDEVTADTLARTIIHVDVNAFYASCEQVRRPELRGKPVIVGEDERRSVVSAASYEARKFGVHSAMPIFKVKELCPDAIFLPVDMAYYASVSQQIFQIFNQYSYKVEKAGLDEAFIDVTGALKLFGNAVTIGKMIIDQVKRELQLDCCVGIGRSKSVAKLASGLAKPADKKGNAIGITTTAQGVLEIPASQTRQFLAPLEVRKLFGVGTKTAAALHEIGVRKVAQLFEVPLSALESQVGKTVSAKLLQLARGEDVDEVEYIPSLAKSVGREITLAQDMREVRQLQNVLLKLSDEVASNLRQQNIYAKTIALVIKTSDHIRYTRSQTLSTPTSSGYLLFQKVKGLLSTWLAEDTRKIRLIGLSTSNFVDGEISFNNQTLFESVAPEADQLSRIKKTEQVVDSIRSKLGYNSIGIGH
jgi:DNA polymerase-4